MKILITGGAGFVGSRLAFNFREAHPRSEILCLDNLMRRGSEINLPEFKKRNISFRHGDIRNPEDLENLGENFDVMIEASAEPSVHAGMKGSPRGVIETNLSGATNCFEFARNRVGFTIFISTSRVYSIEALKKLPLTVEPLRYEISGSATGNGFSVNGIGESFETGSFRSFYGSTKLAAELLLQEYQASYGLKSVINRCGVICGEGQWGKTDQGVFTLWVARHLFGGSLKYTGFTGQGHQVRDLLHPEDLFQLFEKQISRGQSYPLPWNVGGGIDFSVSLQEYTRLCEASTGRSLSIGSDTTTAAVDIPYYVSDISAVNKEFSWAPKISPAEITKRVTDWLSSNQDQLRGFFSP